MIWDELESGLAELAADGLLRRRRVLDSPCAPECVVDGRAVVSFCSNDYLGFANHPELIAAAQAAAAQWGVGSGASHLVSGHLRPHEEAEQALADFVGFPAAITLSTGYMANLAIVPALVGRGDAVFADKLNHASLIDAVQLSRAESHRYLHGDVAGLAAMLAASTAKRKLILTDAVFSMDGDIAPLPQLYELAERHDARLVIDDAHGFGVLGDNGRGTLSHFDLPADPRVILMGTLGKAAGVAGAFVAADRRVVDWLVNKARAYIFTTAASPILATTVTRSVALIAAADDRRAHLQALVAQLRAGVAELRWNLLPSETAIQPLIIGDNHEALRVAGALFERGLWVPAIRPPTVAKGTARLRISLSAAHTEAQVAQLVDALRALA
ncbi:8-amino-7-oxononanoate synthase [Azospira restricta]|uniref:8-amino-7-oxononanoate synthase n=1 Tax=Azospira restricta TaxID=404405 RepID=A0A974SM09_9RHOO|nr:8-amino-7-oxononanoate synthase [Azospira restricta]QRJ62230.1 8-amino-7-oxononanoate synthase [Azospira restricta]